MVARMLLSQLPQHGILHVLIQCIEGVDEIRCFDRDVAPCREILGDDAQFICPLGYSHTQRQVVECVALGR